MQHVCVICFCGANNRCNDRCVFVPSRKPCDPVRGLGVGLGTGLGLGLGHITSTSSSGASCKTLLQQQLQLQTAPEHKPVSPPSGPIKVSLTVSLVWSCLFYQARKP